MVGLRVFVLVACTAIRPRWCCRASAASLRCLIAPAAVRRFGDLASDGAGGEVGSSAATPQATTAGVRRSSAEMDDEIPF